MATAATCHRFASGRSQRRAFDTKNRFAELQSLDRHCESWLPLQFLTHSRLIFTFGIIRSPPNDRRPHALVVPLDRLHVVRLRRMTQPERQPERTDAASDQPYLRLRARLRPTRIARARMLPRVPNLAVAKPPGYRPRLAYRYYCTDSRRALQGLLDRDTAALRIERPGHGQIYPTAYELHICLLCRKRNDLSNHIFTKTRDSHRNFQTPSSEHLPSTRPASPSCTLPPSQARAFATRYESSDSFEDCETRANVA